MCTFGVVRQLIETRIFQLVSNGNTQRISRLNVHKSENKCHFRAEIKIEWTQIKARIQLESMRFDDRAPLLHILRNSIATNIRFHVSHLSRLI